MTNNVIDSLKMSGKNFFAVQDSDLARIRLSRDGVVNITADLKNSALLATDKNQYGPAKLRDIVAGFSPFEKAGKFKRLVLEYTDSKGKAQRDLLSLERGSNLSVDGKVLSMSARVFSDQQFLKGRHARVAGDSNFVSSALRGFGENSEETVSNVRFYFDTFTKRELKKFVKEQRLKAADATARVKINSVALKGADDMSIRQNALGVYELVDESYNFPGSDASAGITFSIAPEFDATIAYPDVEHWWDAYQYFDPSLYSFNLDVGFSWDADAYFDPGTGDGEITLATQSYDGPQIDFPVAGIVDGDISSGIDFSADAIIGALNQDNYQFSASQYLGLQASVGSDGIAITNQSDNSIRTTYPTVDKLTGLGFGATIAPWVELALGLGVAIPYFGDVNFATAGLDIDLPISLDLEDSASSSSLTFGVSGDLSAEATLVPFILGGLTLSTPQLSLFNLSTGNLLA